MIEELQTACADVKATFQAVLKLHQAYIKDLKTDNESNQKTKSRNDLIIQMKSKWDKLENKLLKTIEQLLAEIFNLAKELTMLNDSQKVS